MLKTLMIYDIIILVNKIVGENTMKKNIKTALSIILIFSLVLTCIFAKGIYYYIKCTIPNKSYFNEQYIEVLHPMSFEDRKKANKIMKMIEDAFSFIGNQNEAEKKFQELNRFCITREDAVLENHDLKLITADFKENEGYLWFVYNHMAFNADNQLVYGSHNIMVRATLKKTDDCWIVIETKEHP